MVVLGVSSIMPILPQVVQALGIAPSSVGLVITSFTVPGILLAPLSGVLADRIGRKKVVIPSLLIFGTFGTMCGFAPDLPTLLVFRFLQGVGAGPLGVLALTMIGDMYSGRERTAAMGYNAAVLSIGTGAYPAIGGALALLGWRYPFFLPALSFPLTVLVLFGLDIPEPKGPAGLKEYFKGAFSLMRDKQVGVLLSVTLITFILLYGPFITYFPILMGQEHKAGPLVIGLIISSASLLTALSASQLGKLIQAFSEKKLIRTAFVLYAVSFSLMPFIDSLWGLVVPAVIFGFAQGLNIPNVTSLLSGCAAMENRAAVMAVNGMLLRVGQTIGPVLMGFLYAMAGMKGVFFTGACLALLVPLLILPSLK